MYLWEIPDNYPERLIGTYDREASPDRFSFKQGRALPPCETLPVVRFDCESSDLKGFDDLASSAMVPIVSERVQKLLRDCAGDDVQLIDVEVATNDGALPGYRLVNATNSVKVIDHQASDYKLIPGTKSIMKFRKLMVLHDAMGSHALARDAEYMSHLLVSDALADKLLALNLRQVGLYRPKDMTW